jgi:hypothetical protein
LYCPEDLAILGRHEAVDNESEIAIRASVLESFQAGKPLTGKQLLDMVHKGSNPRFTKGWLNTFIGRHLDEKKVCRSVPQEDARCERTLHVISPRWCSISMRSVHLNGRIGGPEKFSHM